MRRQFPSHTGSTYSLLPHPEILRLRTFVITSSRGGKTDDERMVGVWKVVIGLGFVPPLHAKLLRPLPWIVLYCGAPHQRLALIPVRVQCQCFTFSIHRIRMMALPTSLPTPYGEFPHNYYYSCLPFIFPRTFSLTLVVRRSSFKR